MLSPNKWVTIQGIQKITNLGNKLLHGNEFQKIDIDRHKRITEENSRQKSRKWGKVFFIPLFFYII
jgi:hypothetical protein